MTLQQALDAGVAHHRAGRLAEAEKAYRAVLAVNPAQVDALNLLGMIAYATGHPGEAVDLTSRALRGAPDNAIFLNNHAQALQRLGRNDQALKALRRAVTIDQTLAEARHNLGALLSEMGDAKAAETEFAALLRLTPGDAMAHTDHGHALQDCGRWQEALEEHRARRLGIRPCDCFDSPLAGIGVRL